MFEASGMRKTMSSGVGNNEYPHKHVKSCLKLEFSRLAIRCVTKLSYPKKLS